MIAHSLRGVRRLLRRVVPWCAAAMLGTALAAQAQTTAAAADAHAVSGRVMHPDAARGDTTGMAPAPNVWVTLHRVGRDAAGPIDSVRTTPAGAYRFRFAPSGAPDAVYFASVSWDGIAYFTPPLRNASTEGADADITVFDTTSRTFPLTVRGRHLIVGAADSTDERTVIEVFELSNDSVRALVASDNANPTPTWSVAVPQAARDPRASEGDISPDAFSFAPGRVSVYAPIAPGVKQISFSYKVPASSFPVAFLAEQGAVVFEILLEEAQGTVSGEGFASVASVTLEGRNFRRYLGQDVPAGARPLVELPTSRVPGRNLYIAGLLVAVGFLMLLVLSRAMGKRAATATSNEATMRGLPPDRPLQVPMHERLAAEIAALDAIFARTDSPSTSMRAAYDSRRAELVGALADELSTTRDATTAAR